MCLEMKANNGKTAQEKAFDHYFSIKNTECSLNTEDLSKKNQLK